MQALFVLAFVLALREGRRSRLAGAAAAVRPGGAGRGRRPPTPTATRGRCGWGGERGLDRDRAASQPRGAARARAVAGRRVRPARFCRPRRAGARADGRVPQLRDLRSGRARVSATSSPRSHPSRGSASGLPAISGSPRAAAPSRHSATTWVRRSPRSCCSTDWSLCWLRRETAILAGLLAVVAVLGRRPRWAPPTRRRRRSRWPPRSRRWSSSCRCCEAGRRPLRARRGRLRNARPRQRPGRPDRVLAGADRPAPAGRRRLDPGARLRSRSSRPNTASATSSGSCAAGGSAWSRRVTWRGGRRLPGMGKAGAGAPRPARRPLRDHRRRLAHSPLCRPAPPQGRRSVPAVGDGPAPHGSGDCPLIAVRQARQGPAGLAA